MASALMTKMKMAAKDRPKVRAECMRLLSRLKLDPARSKMIGAFIESYLQLTAEEMKQYEREIAKFMPEERETTVALISSWEQKGIEKGLHEGVENLVIRQIRHRFGAVADAITRHLNQLSSEQLSELGVALFDFTSFADLEQWLAGHQSVTS